MTPHKNRLLFLLELLNRETDEEHPITAAEIIDHMAVEGFTATRKTVTKDIATLQIHGIDVVCNKSRQNQYFIGNGLLETPELKLLIDAMQASKFLTVRRSRVLIDKLLTLTSRHQAKHLKRGLFLERQIKPNNETAYITSDMLWTAIQTKRRIQFMYVEYGPDKKKTYKHGRRVYEFSPWAFVWDSDKYYVIGHSGHHGKTVKFRVDRIAAPKLTDLPAIPAPEDFDLAEYVKSVFQMYDGPMLDVTLKCRNDTMKTLIDRFGENMRTEIADTEHFYAYVKVAVSSTFFGRIFEMDGAVQITAPESAVKEYRDMLNRARGLQ